MATDELIIKKKREAPASESRSAKTKMGQQKMALLHQGLTLFDNGSRHVHGDGCFKPMRKAETPASDSQSAKTKKGQEMQQQSSSRHVDLDSDYYPSDEELASVTGKQFVALDNPYGDVGYGPIRTMRPESVRNGQGKLPGSRIKPGAKKTSTKKNSPGLVKTYKRKRGRPAGSKSAKNKIEQNPVLFDSNCRSRTFSNGANDNDFEPPTPMRKTNRPARSKSIKRKMKYKPLLVGSSSSSEGKEDKDDNFHPGVSGDGDGPKKNARINGTALKRAVELEKKLPAEGPSFIKGMMHSQVVKGFWLGMPASFCRDHMLNHDHTIVLEDEERKTYETNYIAYKTGLSGGWKGFVRQKHLKVDDAVVFQLVRQTTFKVYILRENEFTGTDGALGLLSLDTSMDNKKEKESSNEHANSKEAVDGGIRFPCSDIDDFASVKSFVDFKIVIGNGLLVLPDHLRMTYYHLCQARKAFLHRNLLKTISPEFTTRMIVETANIAEGIRASSPASLEDLAEWKKILESFEAKGMDVALMRKRVDDLLGLLGAPSQITVVLEGYEAVRLEQARAAKELRAIESTVSTLKDSLDVFEVKMEDMVAASTRMKEQAMRKLATAPW